jgi:NAD(P)-dependent dehydrogenase (short-subunit alcohol dehydrogenase family)
MTVTMSASSPLDVTDESSIQALAETVRGLGRLDVLVNNAGIVPDPMPGSEAASVFRADLETVRRGMETNALAPLRLCQVLIPLMQGRGRVVNVSSGMGQLDEMNGCCPGYRLSKVSLNALTRIFADELRDTGVKVNSVCPGWVRTNLGGPNGHRYRWRKGQTASSGRRPCRTTGRAAAFSAMESGLPGRGLASLDSATGFGDDPSIPGSRALVRWLSTRDRGRGST